MLKTIKTVAATTLALLTVTAHAEIDGHGPDAWRVIGISANDVLNARMGPGTNYPVIETFAHNERGLQQITCVPYYTLAHYEAMSEAQIKALPPRWCLMRTQSMSKAGWVAQRHITPDDTPPTAQGAAEPVPTVSSAIPMPEFSGDSMVDEAQRIIHELYTAQSRAEQGLGPDPFEGDTAEQYFTSEIVALLQSGGVGAHPLHGAQDFDGHITRIAPDAKQAMFRGMITVHVDFTNFGQAQRATFLLRTDAERPDTPLRIFRVEHDGWSYP